ncbi:unnamed protein product [Mytilus coruscus]|uniref:HYR domain-containing protein n=1 Tax=Mytilus coruscus TaxID=42192 RepID=A0A6J8A6W1_MYTCO|nr:unnamed protein product [Mytilus coruscus]
MRKSWTDLITLLILNISASQIFPFSGFLVQLSVTKAEECPFEDILTLNSEKGKDYAVVNPHFPGAHHFSPKLPKRIDGDSGKNFFTYIVGNDTECWFDIVVKIVRCKQEISNISDYVGGANCSNLIWGTSCNAACSEGKVSVGGPAVFTCEMDNNNMTYLQLDNDTVCQDSAYALKCPKDITIYTDTSYLIVASITLDKWTIPTSLDSNGKPWKIESQTAEEKKYFIGRYTNIVTATSSTGEITSCKFDFIIKLLGCTVPQVEESTIKGAVPNKTYHISTNSHDYEKKICKQGYAFKQPNDYKDFVEVKCLETSPGHTEWKNWNSRNCTKNEIPKICGREVKLDGKETEVVYFSYDFMEWMSMVEQNITSCRFRALVDVYKPPMYDLEMKFQTNTATPLTADKCFFEVLLYAGESSLGIPIKKFDCTLKGSVNVKWPTLDFTLVFRVLDSFKSHQHTDLTGNGTILFSMKKCSNCALSDVTGLDVIESEIPSFKCELNPSLPCRMDGCLEDSLQMFRLKLAPNSRHEKSDLAYKTCSANIDVQSSTKKICFHLAHLSNTINCRRKSRDKYLNLLIHMDSFFTLVIKCDDLQGWWCLPQDLPKLENLTITWDFKTYLLGSITEELWVLSVSSVNNSQSCSQPIIYTTPTPEKVTPRDYSSGLTIARILGIVFGVLSAVCTTCAGGYCCFKKRKSKGKTDTVPDDVRLSMVEKHNDKH